MTRRRENTKTQNSLCYGTSVVLPESGVVWAPSSLPRFRTSQDLRSKLACLCIGGLHILNEGFNLIVAIWNSIFAYWNAILLDTALKWHVAQFQSLICHR